MQFSLLSRIKEYYTDLKCEKHHELFRPGNVLWVLALIPIMVVCCLPGVIIYCFIRDGGFNNNTFPFFGFLSFLILAVLSCVFIYTCILASYILIKDGKIKYVCYFIKAQVINIDEIKECTEVWLHGVARSIEIKDISGKTIVFNYSFCSLKDLKTIMTLIGYPNFIRVPDNNTNKSIKKRKQTWKITKTEKEYIKRILCIIISCIVVLLAYVVLFYFLRRYFFVPNIIDRASTLIVFLGGIQLSKIVARLFEKLSVTKILLILFGLIVLLVIVIELLSVLNGTSL